ncbi:MAG: ClbS/DfsB family four-helix bundle protein [Eubacterium sp.]|nr:ClbS/DfsB family four-helix bundle protein [Eubacterium sp.]
MKEAHWKQQAISDGRVQLENLWAMNIVFYSRCQNISEEEALQKFKESHRKVMKALETFSQEELFTNTYYPWVGGSCIGSYFIYGILTS